eukprot:TRINITY_DN1120_c0_g1_i1.p1 TRINITY_DN1120_c0_g1~~TRINITY_DN1120_c0_g1_i1.p1  ORF type:complete len:604 (+),score=181.76 TRINITY_DN1120_c0_g1_i1:243-1814(+)
MKSSFRLFMTTEIHPKLPANLLRLSQIFVFEPPPGIKANLQHTFSNIPVVRMEKAPVERSRMYFLLAWLHAVIQERLRYAPLGWTKTFEFNEADQRCALDTLDYWIDSASAGRQNLAPEKIPWVALRTLLGQTVYGGRVDNIFDLRLLDSFLEQLFTEHSFDADFPLFKSIGNQTTLTIPESATKRSQFLKWVENLPNTESPLWLGLPENAEVLLLTKKGQSVLRKLLKLQTIEEDTGDSNDSQTQSGDRRPAWMVILRASIDVWLKGLPERCELFERTSESIKNPLFRFFEREAEIGSRLLKKVRADLQDLIQVCDGNLKQTNYTRELISNLSKGVIPKEWKKYPIASSTSISIWIVDFAKRIRQLQKIKRSSDYGRSSIWMGGLFLPEAYITATRQSAAQAHLWSVENIELHMEILGKGEVDVDETSFVVTGMTLESAVWNGKTLGLTNEISSSLPPVKFTWKLKPKEGTPPKTDVVTLPIYLNETRAEFLVAVDLPKPSDVSAISLYQRGIALNVWQPDV